MRTEKLSVKRKIAAYIAAGLAAVLVPGVIGYILTVKPVHFPVVPLHVQHGEGGTIFSAEVATSKEQISRGLMYRDQLADDAGMVFILPKPQEVRMWMKNTPLSLDMVFADARGVIKFIHPDTIPFSTDLITYGNDIQYVVEFKAGTASRLQLAAGDRVSSPGLFPPQ